jgi:hypothetical protein
MQPIHDMSKLLMRYLRLAIREAYLSRVSNQLVSVSDSSAEQCSGTEEQGQEELETDVNEFAGVGTGGIMGFSGPLGGGNADHPTASVGKRKKRRK